MAAKGKGTKFDTAMIAKMEEPISIRIARKDRMTGNLMPIMLTQAQWNREDAKRIEEIVLNDIAGGGTYVGEMTGANGVGFEWNFAFPEASFPPKIPPTMAAAAAPAPPDPRSAPPGTTWVPSYGGVPQPAQPMFVPQNPSPPSYSSPRFPGNGQPGYGGQPYGAAANQSQMQYPYQYPPPYSFVPPSSKEEALRAEVEAMKRTAMEAEFRREREAADARHAAEMAELRRAIQEQNTRKPDAELEMLKLQLEQQRQQHERDREERRAAEERRREEERARREEERRAAEERRREEDRRWQAELEARREAERRAAEERQREREAQRLIEEERRRNEQAQREASERRWELQMQMQQQQMQALQAAMSNNPMTAMLSETMRQLSDSERRAADRAANAPMQSMEMARMFKELSGGDTLMRNVTEAYSSAHGIGMRSLELMNQMMAQQQGSPGWEILAQSIQSGKEILSDYTTSKQRSEAAKHKAEQAQAHERMMAHQAAAAQAQAQAFAVQAAQTSDPNVIAQAQQAAAEAQAAQNAHAQTIQNAAQAVDAAYDAEEKREEREAEIFGPAWGEVQRLRAIVAEEDDVEHVRAIIALGVCTAAEQIKQHGIVIPAFTLLQEGRTADLVEHLVPGQTSEFVATTAREIELLTQAVTSRGVEALQEYAEKHGLGGDGEDDEDDDE